MRIEAAVRAAEHAVGIAQADHQRRDDGVGAVHRGLGRLGTHAAPAHDLVIGLPVLAEARIVIRIHAGDVFTQLHAQLGLGNARFDHRRTADEDGNGQALVEGGLRRAQHARILALGHRHALVRRALRRAEDGAREHARRGEHARELRAVGIHVGDGSRGHARGRRRRRHGGRDADDEAGVEGLGDDVVGAEGQFLAGIGRGHFVADLGLGEIRDFLHAGQLHLSRDLRGAAVQRAAEDVGEAQHVVHLVRIIRTTGGDDAVRASAERQFRTDLGLGVGQRQDDGARAHGLDHLGREHAAGGAAQEHIGARYHIGQRAQRGLLRVARLLGIEGVAAAFVDEALGVAGEDVLALQAQAHHQVEAGNGRGAGAGNNYLDPADVLAHQFQAIPDGRGGDDGRAVLVIVEDRDAHALGELALDVEALGRLDVFEVDAAQRGFQRGDDVDQAIRVTLGQLDVEHIDARELLEEAALAFHHRLGGQRPDVAQAQHGCAVGDHAHEIAARGVGGGQRGVGGDVEAGIGYAGRIGQRQIALVRQRLGGRERDLSRRGKAVVVQRGFTQGGFGRGQRLGHIGVLIGPKRPDYPD